MVIAQIVTNVADKSIEHGRITIAKSKMNNIVEDVSRKTKTTKRMNVKTLLEPT